MSTTLAWNNREPETDEAFLLRIGNLSSVDRDIMKIKEGGKYTLNELKILDLQLLLKRMNYFIWCIHTSHDDVVAKWREIDARAEEKIKKLQCILAIMSSIALAILFSTW